MVEGLSKQGVLSKDELSKLPGMPSKERIKKGSVVIIECAEEIPCNPCEIACPQGAIEIGENINTLPVLKEDLCTGCGVCIAMCPGLAIFTVDLIFSKKEGLVKIPHEFLPLPKNGEIVKCLNREGKVVSEGRIVKVSNPKGNDRTPVISVAVPKEVAMDVRGIKIKI